MCQSRRHGGSRSLPTAWRCGKRLKYIDATIVSPSTQQAKTHPDAQPGSAVNAAARRKCNNMYPDLGHARRCRLVVIGTEIAAKLAARFAPKLSRCRRQGAATCRDLSLLALPAGLSYLSCPPSPTLVTGRGQICTSS